MMERIQVSNVKINPIQISQVIKIMAGWIDEKSLGNYVVIANAYDFALCLRDEKIREASNSSSLTVPDGFSLLLLARLYGYSLKKRVYGPQLMEEALEVFQNKEYSHFFYGSTDKILDKLEENVKKKYPKARIAGRFSPPFRQLTNDEESRIIEMINSSNADVLWVGLGCPKQQLWMFEHKDKIKVPVMIGVGAAFDFLAGIKPQAPKWMQNSGLEWLFRLVSEPKRLWKRYLLANTVFLGVFIREFFRIKIVKKRG